jgi:hypothetical protein
MEREKLSLEKLTLVERLIAGTAGGCVLVAAFIIFVRPPQRLVALGQCPRAASGCIVRVDGDVTTFAVALAVIGAIAALIAFLGVRFNQVKAAGYELGSLYGRQTAGLTDAGSARSDEAEKAPATAERSLENVPVKVNVDRKWGSLGTPVAVTHLTKPIDDVETSFLRDYQKARKESQHGIFLTHILGPSTQSPNQSGVKYYSVAIRVTPHEDAGNDVKSASFYLGRSWGNSVFHGKRGPDGRFGIVTEAFGSFLALCEVEFVGGERILLDHYCDFDMASLLPS